MKNKINFIIDVVLFLVVMAIGGIGLLIKYTLIPGSMRWEMYETNVELLLFGLDRHQWGAIHLILGYFFFALLLLHILLHWKQVIHIFKKLVIRPFSRFAMVLLFSLLSIAVLMFGLLLSPEVVSLGRGEGFLRMGQIEKPNNENTREIIRPSEDEKNEISHDEDHHTKESVFKVYGFMTLSEVANTYHVSVDSLKASINIPLSTSNKEKLGRLKRRYEFNMNDIEKYIERIKK